jgi:hypothetical protein
MPDAARFCSSCGASRESATLAGAATRLVGDARRPSSGWLHSSDAISHGRFAPGVLLDGRYRIIGLLGRGGMGEVYRADDLRLGQPVALKLLPEQLRDDPARLAQFHNEVRTARQVSHPNVCRVYDIGETDGLLYLSMEYVDGEDLSSSLRRIGRFPEDRAVEIARQLCAGLAAAHQRGIVHRDLKPANVMVDAEGRVRVMDFGLAAVGTVEDIRAGTPAYMAPEQLLGREVTARSDLFALGLVMYEVFTGRRAFTAATVGELIHQHETRAVPPPSAFVTAIDPAIERTILWLLEPDPGRRPGSALAVAAALPGGDPLAAALAAGETPSPEMVAAAGEGAGLSRRVAWPLFIAVLAGIAASLALPVRIGPLNQMRPEYSAEVLAQKAREALARIGAPDRPRDSAYGFHWDEQLIDHVRRSDGASAQWSEVFSRRPSPLVFWYRQSDQPLTALTFHSDLLTPGIVDPSDPPPIVSGMREVRLDHEGRLTYYEAMPPQRQDAPMDPAAVDWGPLFGLAGLDQAAMQPTPPLWSWLATSDTRAAWTGTWPGSGRPLRIEAAGFGGRPVGFLVMGPWRKPWRMPDAGDEGIIGVILVALAIAVLAGAGALARANLRDGRGDRTGALRLAAGMWIVLLALWACQVHVVASLGFLAMFLLAICTSVFYGVLLWTLYVALEPFVRRQWPQVLVSWTNVLTGRIRDAVVGRDLLIGVAVGVAWVLLIKGMDLWRGGEDHASFPGDLQVLNGLRGTLAAILEEAPYALRNVLLYVFLLFSLRRIVANQWLTALVFGGAFAVLNAIGSDERQWLEAVFGFVFFGSAAVAALHWGLVTLATGIAVSGLLINVPVTLDTSAWYFGNMLLMLGVVVGLAAWGVVHAHRR